MKSIIILMCIMACTPAGAQIEVSTNGRYLQTKDGQPFFWLGDTDWEMFHRLKREEIVKLFTTRKNQGFNVIQAVALAEFNGIKAPNRYGDWPLNNENPEQLLVTPGNNPENEYEYDYWDHVDFAINEASKINLYIGLLPTWGDKVAHLWGDGPIIFNATNAYAYARILAERYKDRKNIIWILGGDRPAVYSTTKDGREIQYDDRAVWRAMANAIEDVLGKEAFITYHPAGGSNSSSQYIHEDAWLDMNAFQSGHGARETDAWNWVTRDLAKVPKKPTLDMEPCYEDHPVNPWDGKWSRARGYFNAYDVRARIYRGVFAGACGVTYGHHSVWQFLNPDLNPAINVGDTTIHWQKAIEAEGAAQLIHLKNLMLSRPYFNRVIDASLVVGNPGKDYLDLVIATRDENKSYAMVYLPINGSITVSLSPISGKKKNVWWFNPRNGEVTAVKSVQGKKATFTTPDTGRDWVLVIDDATKKFPPPGKVK